MGQGFGAIAYTNVNAHGPQIVQVIQFDNENLVVHYDRPIDAGASNMTTAAFTGTIRNDALPDQLFESDSLGTPALSANDPTTQYVHLTLLSASPDAIAIAFDPTTAVIVDALGDPAAAQTTGMTEFP